MKNAPSIQFYPRDFLADADVRMLTHAQRGIFIDLLCYCWERDGLPKEQEKLAKLLNLSQKEAATLLPEVMRLFTETESGYHHDRLLKQQELYAQRRIKAQDKAAKRWHKSDDATALPQHCGSNAIIAVAEEEAEAKAVSSLSVSGERVQGEGQATPPAEPLASSFDRFWAAWPRTDRKQGRKACLAKWKAKHLWQVASAILADIEARKKTRKWQDGYEPAPLTYLNQELWSDGEIFDVRPSAVPAVSQDLGLTPRDTGTPMTPEEIEADNKRYEGINF